MFLASLLQFHWLRYCLKFCRTRPKLCTLIACIALLFLILIILLPQQHESQYHPEKKLFSLPSIAVKPTLHNQSEWHDEIVQIGDTLPSILTRLGIGNTEIDQIMQQPSIKTQIQKLQFNQIFSIRLNPQGQLTDIQFFNDNDNGEKNLVILNKTNNQWHADISSVNTEILPVLKAVVIKTSARGALAQAGIPVQIREALREIFSDKINLDNLQTGDTIRIVYQNLYYRGQEMATGDILAAEVSHQQQLYQAYFFQKNRDDNGQYFDTNGLPLRKGFSRIPVNGARISSPFGMRFHPILNTLLMHSGIDYAVPMGTPIYAPADGIVESIGVKGGYGNTVILRHNNNIETLYGHMSAFANIAAGQKIYVGDVIGYVGMTGRATGPHVHYEVRINGQAVNPASVALPSKPLSTSQLPQFRQQQQLWKQQFDGIRHLKATIAHLD